MTSSPNNAFDGWCWKSYMAFSWWSHWFSSMWCWLPLTKMMSLKTSPPRLSNPTLILSNQANFKYAINAYKTKIRAQVTLSYDHEGNGGQLRRIALENAWEKTSACLGFDCTFSKGGGFNWSSWDFRLTNGQNIKHIVGWLWMETWRLNWQGRGQNDEDWFCIFLR